MTENALWNTVLKRLHDQMGEEKFLAWIDICNPMGEVNGE